MLSIKRLSRDEAFIMIAAAEKKATAIGVPQVIAVADESGNLIAFSRMDGGKASSIQIAMAKAFTAGAARNPTMFYNEHVGGIGVSSGTPAQDVEVAEAGVKALEAHWKRKTRAKK